MVLIIAHSFGKVHALKSGVIASRNKEGPSFPNLMGAKRMARAKVPPALQRIVLGLVKGP